jgi:hypothetical protein
MRLINFDCIHGGNLAETWGKSNSSFAWQFQATALQFGARSLKRMIQELLLKVEIDTAALVAFVSDMDDLALPFDVNDAGNRFIEAWKRARIIVDSGGGPNGNGGTHPALPTPTASNSIQEDAKRPSETRAALLCAEGAEEITLFPLPVQYL